MEEGFDAFVAGLKKLMKNNKTVIEEYDTEGDRYSIGITNIAPGISPLFYVKISNSEKPRFYYFKKAEGAAKRYLELIYHRL